MDKVWLDEPDRRDCHDWLCCQRAITNEREQSKRLCFPAPTSPPESLKEDAEAPPLMVVSDSDDDDDDSNITHLLPHIKRENAIHLMEILAEIQVVIMAIILIMVEIVVWMSKIPLNISVQDTQGGIRRRRTP